MKVMKRPSPEELGRTLLEALERNDQFTESRALDALRLGADLTLTSDNGMTALMRAAKNGKSLVAAEILCRSAAAGIDAGDGSGLTALMYAAGLSHKEIVILLLRHGANVRARDKTHDTALHFAAMEGDKDIVGLLIARGADIAARNRFDVTPAQMADRYNQTHIARLLREIQEIRRETAIASIAQGTHVPLRNPGPLRLKNRGGRKP